LFVWLLPFYDFRALMTNADFYAHPTAVLDPGCQVGAGSRIWHFSHLMPGCTLGENCNVGQNVFIASDVQVGNGVKIQNNVSLYTGLVIEDEVFLGPSCVFTNVANPRSAVNRRDAYLPTRIGKGATIGANATIICGNDIGEYAFVAAGAVVSRPVVPFALVMGCPARPVGWMSAAGERLQFDAQGFARCPATSEQYQLVDGRVKKLA
jgi:UDP-2-acetamido-3-amino-2,3-dideoxy-glucuronate N-acetyltransferase